MKLVVVETPLPLSGQRQTKEFELAANPVRPVLQLGRHSQSDIVIADATVSRSHLELIVWPGGLLVRDLDSKNGTELNASPLPAFKGVAVKPGDKLKVGDAILQVAHSSGPGAISPIVPAKSFNNIKPKISQLVDNSQKLLSPKSGKNNPPVAKPKTARPVAIIAPANLADYQNVFPKSRAELILVGLPWACLAFVSLAELLTATINVQLGLILHALLLIGLAIYSAVGSGSARRKLAMALTVAPLIRLLSLSLPLTSFPQLAWYPIVAVPLLLTTALIVRQMGISRQSIGLQIKNLPLQLALISGGLGLGWTEYAILHPAPVINNYNWLVGTLGVISLVVFTGFNEEIIFRGLLQATAIVVLKRTALIYVALLFAALHIGYLSLFDLIFVFAVGLLFGYIVRWGGSILGVSLAHGLTNVTLFMIMPYLNQNPDGPLAAIFPFLVAAGSLVSLAAILMLSWKSIWKEKSIVEELAAQIGEEILTNYSR